MWRWILALSTVNFIVAQKFQDLQFLFVNGDTPLKYEAFYFNETSKLLSHPDYDVNRPTMLYCYGYTESIQRNSTQTVLAAYMSRKDHNLLVVEWSNYSDGNYFEAIFNSRAVGNEVGQKLWSMKTDGFNLDNFHLVGHSLGGQLIGFIGRSVFNASQNTYKLPKIIALDPAGPFFYGLTQVLTKPLNQNDGRAVHVIHTDSNFFGAPSRSGTADFWPNEGKNQPACPKANWDIYNENNFCSHRRSWCYYAESVRSRDEKTFKAVPCSSWRDFKQNKCPDNDTSKQGFMGFYASSDLFGDYFLQTNPEPPFSRGLQGMYYDETIDDSINELNDA